MRASSPSPSTPQSTRPSSPSKVSAGASPSFPTKRTSSTGKARIRLLRGRPLALYLILWLSMASIWLLAGGLAGQWWLGIGVAALLLSGGGLTLYWQVRRARELLKLTSKETCW